MNNYTILGLAKGAPLKEVKAKFRSLSKQLHPDVNGGDTKKTEKFVIILAAYDALIKGDIGEEVKDTFAEQRKQRERAHYAAQQARHTKVKTAQYRFINIKKEGDFYLVRFHLDGVHRVEMYGKNGKQVGYYTTSNVYGEVNLTVALEAAKKADYVLKITLYDARDNSASVTYKVTPPKVSLYQKFKNLFK